MTSLKPFPYAFRLPYEKELKIGDNEGLIDDDPVTFSPSYNADELLRLAQNPAETKDHTPSDVEACAQQISKRLGLPVDEPLLFFYSLLSVAETTCLWSPRAAQIVVRDWAAEALGAVLNGRLTRFNARQLASLLSHLLWHEEMRSFFGLDGYEKAFGVRS